MKSTKKSVPVVLPSLVDLGKGYCDIKLIISKELQSQMSYCHNKIGSIEWSGVLIYKFKDPKVTISDFYNTGDETIEIIAEKFLLRDIGTGGSTEFELTPEEVFEQGDYQMKGSRLGLIHTHHNMGAYFSGVDDAELKTNTANHEVYVSLVTEYKNGGKPTARVCWSGEVEVKSKIKNSFKFLNVLKSVNSDEHTKEDVVFYRDLIVEYEATDSTLKDKLISIVEKKAKKAAANVKATPLYKLPGVKTYNSFDKGNEWDDWEYMSGERHLNSNTKSTQTSLNLSTMVSSNIKDMILLCKEELEKMTYVSTINFSTKNIAGFVAYLITDDDKEKRSIFGVANSMTNLHSVSVDVLESDMAERLEISLQIYFDDVLLNYETLLICYTALSILEHDQYSKSKVLDSVRTVLTDCIIEEEDEMNMGIDQELIYD